MGEPYPWPKGKLIFLGSIVALYFLFGISIIYLAGIGVIPRLPPTPKGELGSDQIGGTTLADATESLRLAQIFVNKKLVIDGGHINLYYSDGIAPADAEDTNSEAISYYLLWNAQDSNKAAFDKNLDYLEKYMLNSKGNYLMWHLDSYGRPVSDGGSNVATDADLRVIKALLIAESKWGDARYTRLINQLTDGLQNIAVTPDDYFAPYGGIAADGKVWKTDEVWLSYADFEAFGELSRRRAGPWSKIYSNTKTAVINSQLPLGLYNTQLDGNRTAHNSLDENQYSVNSIWVMVRSAESGDKELQDSARMALGFYKERFEQDGALYTAYDSRGRPKGGPDSPWVYALVARAAVALDDEAFADALIERLIDLQVKDKSSDLYGSFPEGNETDKRVSQFTMQESIITLQEYIKHNGGVT